MLSMARQPAAASPSRSAPASQRRASARRAGLGNREWRDGRGCRRSCRALRHSQSFRARRRTPRPAITRRLGQNCDAMTTVTASSHHLPAGGRLLPASHRRRPPNADCMLPSMPKSPRRRRRRRKRLDRDRRSAANSAGQHYPHGAGRPSNPHRRQATRRQGSRVPSLKAFRHRPSAPADRSFMGRYPKPCRLSDF